ncbi:MAG: DNA repair protein RecO, partial [Pseudomonadota bacterium]
MKVHQAPAYILVSRPYSETSSLIDLFTRDYGRQMLMAKGIKRLKSRFRGLAQPFHALLASWSGKGEVPTLTGLELDASRFSGWNSSLEKDARLCGWYCNELLANSLQRADAHQKLFDEYHRAIVNLGELDAKQTKQSALEKFTVLRDFELALIAET